MVNNIGLAFNCAIVLNHFLVHSVTHTAACPEKSAVVLVQQAKEFLKTVWSDNHIMIPIFPIGCHYSGLGQSEEQ